MFAVVVNDDATRYIGLMTARERLRRLVLSIAAAVRLGVRDPRSLLSSGTAKVTTAINATRSERVVLLRMNMRRQS